MKHEWHDNYFPPCPLKWCEMLAVHRHHDAMDWVSPHGDHPWGVDYWGDEMPDAMTVRH